MVEARVHRLLQERRIGWVPAANEQAIAGDAISRADGLLVDMGSRLGL